MRKRKRTPLTPSLNLTISWVQADHVVMYKLDYMNLYKLAINLQKCKTIRMSQVLAETWACFLFRQTSHRTCNVAALSSQTSQVSKLFILWAML